MVSRDADADYNVGGTATVHAGTVVVMPDPGIYANSTTYTILSATGGVSGSYGGVTSNFAFLTPSLSYDANHAFLTLTRNGVPYASVARNPNEAAVAGAIDAGPAASGSARSASSAHHVMVGARPRAMTKGRRCMSVSPGGRTMVPCVSSPLSLPRSRPRPAAAGW